MSGYPEINEMDQHYRDVAKELTEGVVVPFFGAGVNLCERLPGEIWRRDQSKFLPSGPELAEYLAVAFNFPPQKARIYCPICDPRLNENTMFNCHSCPNELADRPRDLARVSQYVGLTLSTGRLYQELRKLLIKKNTLYESATIFGRFP